MPSTDDPNGNDSLEAAAPALSAEMYAGLRELAGAVLGRSPGAAIEPTVLLHEAWMKLAGSEGAPAYDSRSHFFAASAQAMRHILVDFARHTGRAKRGGGNAPVTLISEVLGQEVGLDVLELQECMERLRELDGRAARVVDLRFFAGLNTLEIAEVLGCSERTVRVDWSMARAWLRRELSGEIEADEG